MIRYCKRSLKVLVVQVGRLLKSFSYGKTGLFNLMPEGRINNPFYAL